MSVVIESESITARLSAAPPPAAARLIRVAILGYGRVGQAVAALAEAERGRLHAAGVDIRCVAGLVRDRRRPRSAPAIPLVDRADDVDLTQVDVVVETLGGLEPARSLVTRAIAAGVPVVTANKTLVAHHGPTLSALARVSGAAFAFDAAVLAGVPFLGALARRPFLASARAICGVINGTSHAVLEAVEAGAGFDAAVADAVAQGYAEPDSAADISGRDAAEKLTILVQLAGCAEVRPRTLTCASIDRLSSSDLRAARRLGGRIVPIAWAELEPAAAGAWVGPAFFPEDHPLASLRGVDNAIAIVTGAGHTVRFAGPGAGPQPTAATILDDVVDVAYAGRPTPRIDVGRPAIDLSTPPAGHWLVVAHAGHDAAVVAAIESSGLSILRSATDGESHLHLTSAAGWREIAHAAETARARGVDAFVLPAPGGPGIV